MGAVGASKTTTSIGEYTVTAGPEGADWADNPMLGINLFNKGKEALLMSNIIYCHSSE